MQSCFCSHLKLPLSLLDLHTLQIRDSTIHYIMYEVGSNNGLCRSIRQNLLPLVNNRQSLLSFLGANLNSVCLATLNSTDIPRLLIDGNRLLYPFIYNQDGTNLKEPQWKNLLGINYFSQGIVPLKNADHLNKNHIILNIMQIQKGILIPHILRYDVERIRSILNEIELTKNRDLLKLILEERLDGCRNLFHACVHIATPTNNKEYSINDEQVQNESNTNLKRISFAIDLLHAQGNSDHNYGERSTASAPTTISSSATNNVWTNDPTPTDAQPPSSPTMPSGTSSNLYRVRILSSPIRIYFLSFCRAYQQVHLR